MIVKPIKHITIIRLGFNAFGHRFRSYSIKFDDYNSYANETEFEHSPTSVTIPPDKAASNATSNKDNTMPDIDMCNSATANTADPVTMVETASEYKK
jgi:hypothetical protein